MSAVNFLVIGAGGKRTQSASTGLTPDFTGVRVGADVLPLVQGGAGGTAYFDFGSRSLRTSFTPSNVGDLTNLGYLQSTYAALSSPALTGTPTAPTASGGTNTTQIATTAFVAAAVSGIVTVTTWANAVLDYISTPPGSPATGDRYLVAPTGTGAWASHNNQIATWSGSAWTFHTEVNGTFVDVISYALGVYFFNGTAWSTKDFEATTASNGLKLVSRDIQRDDSVAKTNDNASAITIRQIVYVKANGNVDLANSSGGTAADSMIGVVEDASIASAGSGKIDLRQGAIIGGFSSLTPGAAYYISNATAGAIALYSAMTWVTGDSVISVGKAISATQLLLNPNFEFIF